MKTALILLLLGSMAVPASVAYAAPGTPAQAAQPAQAAKEKPADVAGDWTMVFETPRENTVQVVLRQQGEKLTGFVSMERGEIPLTGLVSGNDMRINWTIYEGGQKVDIVFNGKVEKETYTGTSKSVFGDGNLWGQRTSKAQ